jgi:hypothetical protein
MAHRVLVRVLGHVILATTLLASHVASAQDCEGVQTPCSPGTSGTAPAAPVLPMAWIADDGPIGIYRVSGDAMSLFYDKLYDKLDALIARYAELNDRLDDGRFKLSGITQFFDDAFSHRPKDTLLKEVESWRAANPKSAGAALLESSYWLQAAWQARGNGFANTVSPEGWQLFKERLKRAAGALAASESDAARNPLWYVEGLEVGLASGEPLAKLFVLYQRGIKAFPEYFPLHFQMVNALQPRWGGSNEAIKAFIEVVVKQSPPNMKAQLYTRLWWYVDQVSELDVNVFRDMGASWPRMKSGFESLEANNPKSMWTRSNFASFACRAYDAATYIRLRRELGDQINGYATTAFRSNASIDVCDARTKNSGAAARY